MKCLGILLMLAGVACAAPDQNKLAHITQDCIDLDLGSGKVSFNDAEVSMDDLAARLESSYSVSLSAAFHSDEVPDLFAPPVESSEIPPFISAEMLLRVFEEIKAADLSPKLVRLNLNFEPALKRNFYHHIKLGEKGGIFLNGSHAQLADIREKQKAGMSFVISPESETMSTDYSRLLSVLRAVGPDGKIAGLSFVDMESIEVEALLFKLEPDGSHDVFSAPKVTTKSGNQAIIRVVTNGTGQRKYEPWMDEYHQEDLANLGVRFFVRPQIICDYKRLTGSVVITKLHDRQGVFLHNEVPVASYSCMKFVVPLSLVFPPGVESIEIPAAELDGKKTMCRITARIVDHRGMTREQRETARRIAEQSKIQKGQSESRSN